MEGHDVAGLMTCYAADAVAVSPVFRTLTGRAAIEASFDHLFRVVPDYRVDAEESFLIHEGDRAAEVTTASASTSVSSRNSA